MRFSVLGSGSQGNACYIEAGPSRILIDAGLTCRELTRRFESINSDPGTLQGLFITHEHSDHVKGAGPVARRFDIPVFCNNLTLDRCRERLGILSRPLIIRTGQTVEINDLRVTTFTKCHDAVDPMGVVVCSNGLKLGLITDLGRSTALVEDRLKGCNALVIEFNHDRRMLEEGPYPLDLKRRIRGPEGHLSNTQAGELLKALCHKDLKILVLAHLSKTNNLDELAREEATRILEDCGMRHVRVLVSRQEESTPLLEL